MQERTEIIYTNDRIEVSIHSADAIYFLNGFQGPNLETVWEYLNSLNEHQQQHNSYAFQSLDNPAITLTIEYDTHIDFDNGSPVTFHYNITSFGMHRNDMDDFDDFGEFQNGNEFESFLAQHGNNNYIFADDINNNAINNRNTNLNINGNNNTINDPINQIYENSPGIVNPNTRPLYR